jgi:hypothetical protein
VKKFFKFPQLFAKEGVFGEDIPGIMQQLFCVFYRETRLFQQRRFTRQSLATMLVSLHWPR